MEPYWFRQKRRAYEAECISDKLLSLRSSEAAYNSVARDAPLREANHPVNSLATNRLLLGEQITPAPVAVEYFLF